MPAYPRHQETSIRTALRDTRVVTLIGPRQSGKTTLARRFANKGRVYLTLDDQATLAAALSDPVSFIKDLNRAVIDEVQRAPDILLAIKRSVDEDRRPGRFLLTGSANLATIATVRESLAGRVESIALYPLSRAELLRHRHPTFIDSAFRNALPAPTEDHAAPAVPEIVSQGGYPEALTRRSERRRQDWYRAYVESVLERDLPDIASLNKPGHMPRLLQFAARFSGQLLNLSEIGRNVSLDYKTTDSYLQILEQLFLLQRLPPWHRNELSRLVKTPKLHFVDTGLLMALRGHSTARIKEDRSLLGSTLECFAFSELLKASQLSETRVQLYHYRDKDQLEVDFVLESDAGEVVGIEVKAATSLARRDFAGLDRLAAACGKTFKQGIVLYGGKQTLSFAPHLRAAPLSCLWS
jgi:uncharacterized protein